MFRNVPWALNCAQRWAELAPGWLRNEEKAIPRRCKKTLVLFLGYLQNFPKAYEVYLEKCCKVNKVDLGQKIRWKFHNLQYHIKVKITKTFSLLNFLLPSFPFMGKLSLFYIIKWNETSFKCHFGKAWLLDWFDWQTNTWLMSYHSYSPNFLFNIYPLFDIRSSNLDSILEKIFYRNSFHPTFNSLYLCQLFMSGYLERQFVA